MTYATDDKHEISIIEPDTFSNVFNYIAHLNDQINLNIAFESIFACLLFDLKSTLQINKAIVL